MKPLIANLGGVFVYSEKANELADWYKKAFNIHFDGGPDSFYTSWSYDQEGRKKMAVFSIISTKNRGNVSGMPFRINLRVESMQTVMEHFTQQGILFSKAPEFYPGEGWFGWLEDLDGNSIELWEDGFTYE